MAHSSASCNLDLGNRLRTKLVKLQDDLHGLEEEATSVSNFDTFNDSHLLRLQETLADMPLEYLKFSGSDDNVNDDFGMASSGSAIMRGLNTLASPRTRPRCKSTLHSFDEEKKKHARGAVAQFLYLHNLPLHIVDHPITQQLFDTIIEAGPGFQIPSYKDVRTTLLDEVKSDITSSLVGHRRAWERTGCSLMCDGWTDKRGRSLLNLMVASHEGTTFLKAIDSSTETKTDDYLQGVLAETIREIGEDKVVQVLSNNAANFINASDLLTTTFSHLVHTPCAAHCIDLMLEDIGKISWVNAVIKIARRMTKFLYAHTVIHNHMLTMTKKEILRLGTTRFATNFILLRSLYDVRDGLSQMFASVYWRSEQKFARYRSSPQCIEAKRNVLDDGYWERVEVVMKIVAPIITVLCLVDGKGQPMGELYRSMQVCKEEIKKTLEEADENDKFREVEHILDTRWKSQMYQDIHAAAHALNPRYGFGNYFDDAESIDIMRRLARYIQRSFDDIQYAIALQKELAMYKEGVVPSKNPATRMGIHTLEPYSWWMTNALEYPRLAKLATRILTQPCSSSGCERNWSVSEQIHIKRCNKLASQRLNDLVYVHYNLKLHYMDLMKPMSSFVTMDDMDISTPVAQWMPRRSRASIEPPLEAVAQGSLSLATCASSFRAGLHSSDDDDDFYGSFSNDDECFFSDDDVHEDDANANDDHDTIDTCTPIVTYSSQKMRVKRRRDDET